MRSLTDASRHLQAGATVDLCLPPTTVLCRRAQLASAFWASLHATLGRLLCVHMPTQRSDPSKPCQTYLVTLPCKSSFPIALARSARASVTVSSAFGPRTDEGGMFGTGHGASVWSFADHSDPPVRMVWPGMTNSELHRVECSHWPHAMPAAPFCPSPCLLRLQPAARVSTWWSTLTFSFGRVDKLNDPSRQ